MISSAACESSTDCLNSRRAWQQMSARQEQAIIGTNKKGRREAGLSKLV
jgi:hypothetical protein